MLVEKDERYQGVAKHSSGFKLLASMGWKEGEGLGAKRQGMKSHIKVRKVQDNAGIGLAEAVRKAKDWTVGMAAYDQVLAKLKNAGSESHSEEASKQPEKSSKRKQRSISDQKEDTKKKAKIKNEATLAKQEAASAAAAATDSIEGSSSRSEAAVSAVKAAAMRASHTARFGRRRTGKNVRSYSGSDLAAILGGNAPAAARGREASMPAPAEAPRRVVVALTHDSTLEGPDAQQDQPGDEERWWYSTFVRSGRLGSSTPQPAPASDSKPKVKITGFSEDDQTNLYNMAHDASGKGRQGLGIANRPKKVAGARWAGTKKRIDESSDDEAPALPAVDAAQHADSEDCSEDTHLSSQEETHQHTEQEVVEQQSQQQSKQPEPAQHASASKEGVSTKALVRCTKRVLRAAPGGQLRQKKLEKRVLDLLELQRGSSERKQMRKALLAALETSEKFNVSDGIVSL